MKNKIHYLVFGLIFIISACNHPVKLTTTSAAKINPAKYRIQYADSALSLDAPQRLLKNRHTSEKKENDVIENYANINEELNSHLRSISYQNKKVKYFRGYVVQIYSGGNRQEADDHIRNVRAITDEDVKLEYKEPNYKVHVGNYLDRTQAHFTYTQVKELFPNTVIVRSKIEIQRYKYEANRKSKENKSSNE